MKLIYDVPGLKLASQLDPNDATAARLVLEGLDGARIAAGALTVKAVPNGFELRAGSARIFVAAIQVAPMVNAITAHFERVALEPAAA